MAPSHYGYWGEITSTLDWCELNYEVTPYVAEFWNTITNLIMIVIPFFGFYDAYKFKLEKRFVFMMGLLLITGLGSWMFHMTLWYEMQLLDELPMVWGSAGMVYILREIKSNVPNYRLGFSLLLYCLTFTVLYLCKFTSPYVFQTLYGILVVVILVVGIQLVATHPDKIGIKLFLLAILNYGVGFALWNIDNQLCPDLSHMRYRYVAKTLRPLTQFHALWHLLAGYATYLQILTCLYYRYKFKKFLTTLQWSNWRGFYIRISSKSKEE